MRAKAIEGERGGGKCYSSVISYPSSSCKAEEFHFENREIISIVLFINEHIWDAHITFTI